MEDYLPRYEASRDNGYFCLLTCNHDTLRPRYNLDEAELKLAFAFIFTMPGVPYLYYGDEIGMRYLELPTKEGGYFRTGSRTPMQWSGDENGGFTTGEPWFAVNPNYTRINAKEALEDENSVFYYYQKLIRLRKENPVFVNGKFELLLPEDERIFAYTRTDEHTKMLVCTNFTDEEVSCPLLDEWKAGEVWIRNYEDDREGNILRPYEAVIIAFTGK